MRDHLNLRAFVLADEIAIEVYRITQKFPKEEMYGLKAQIRRAAISVPSNIVEGCTRKSQKDFYRFLEIAYGSLKELKYQCQLANKLGMVSSNELSFCLPKFLETEKVLGTLMSKVRTL